MENNENMNQNESGVGTAAADTSTATGQESTASTSMTYTDNLSGSSSEQNKTTSYDQSGSFMQGGYQNTSGSTYTGGASGYTQSTSNMNYGNDYNQSTSNMNYGNDYSQNASNMNYGNDYNQSTSNMNYGNDYNQSTSNMNYGNDYSQNASNMNYGNEYGQSTQGTNYGDGFNQGTSGTSYSGYGQDPANAGGSPNYSAPQNNQYVYSAASKPKKSGAIIAVVIIAAVVVLAALGVAARIAFGIITNKVADGLSEGLAEMSTGFAESAVNSFTEDSSSPVIEGEALEMSVLNSTPYTISYVYFSDEDSGMWGDERNSSNLYPKSEERLYMSDVTNYGARYDFAIDTIEGNRYSLYDIPIEEGMSIEIWWYDDSLPEGMEDLYPSDYSGYYIAVDINYPSKSAPESYMLEYEVLND